MLLKGCTQYGSKFVKLSSGQKTGKGVLISIPKKGNNAKEYSNYCKIVFISHTSRTCSKSFKLGFKIFQIYQLDLEKAEESEIKLPTTSGSQNKHRNSRKASTSTSVTMWKPLTVWITINCGKYKMGISDHLTCLLRNLHAGQEATVRTRHGTTD